MIMEGRTDELRTSLESWSGRGDLNPRLLAWEARTLPLSYARSREVNYILGLC